MFGRKTHVLLLVSLLSTPDCNLEPAEHTGTLGFRANGEDFVREGFVSEDGWRIDFDAVYVNVYGPTAYQVKEPQAQTHSDTYHGGHPHSNIPEGSAHVSLKGEYHLALKQAIFELGSVDNAPIGNYNRSAFRLVPTTADSHAVDMDNIGYSIVLKGKASKPEQSEVKFSIRFHEALEHYDCGPNGLTGVLAEDDFAFVELTFHFDHIFGDAEEGPPEPEDPDTVNHVAIGFEPFAKLASNGILDINQNDLGQKMNGATYLKLIEAIRTLGHNGEGHCYTESLE